MEPEVFDRTALRNERPTDTAIPRFFTKAAKDTERSNAEGKAIFKDVEYIEIRIPGDRFNVIERAASDHNKARFAVAYEKFKKGVEQKPDGFPLQAWNTATPALIATLAEAHCYTVEQFANMAESGLPKYPEVLKLQRQARDFLEAREDSARINQLQHQIEALQAQLATRDEKIEALEQQLAQSKPVEGGVRRRAV